MVTYRFSMLFAWCVLFVVGYGVGFREPRIAYESAFFLSAIGSLAACYFFDSPPPRRRGHLLVLATLTLVFGAFAWSEPSCSPAFAPVLPALTSVLTLMLIWLGGPGRMPFVLLLLLLAIGTGLVLLHRHTWPDPPGSAASELGMVWGVTLLAGLGASLISRTMTPTVDA